MTTLMRRNRNPITTWDAFREFEDRLNQIFGDLPMEPESEAGQWLPQTDLYETDDAYVLEADLPGMNKDDIDVSVSGDVVTLKGERQHEDQTVRAQTQLSDPAGDVLGHVEVAHRRGEKCGGDQDRDLVP